MAEYEQLAAAGITGFVVNKKNGESQQFPLDTLHAVRKDPLNGEVIFEQFENNKAVPHAFNLDEIDTVVTISKEFDRSDFEEES